MAIDFTKKLILRTALGGAIIVTISPEANVGNVPQWVVKAPDGVVIYRITQQTSGSGTTPPTKTYSVKTKDGGEVAYIQPISNMLPITWTLRAKLGGSIIATIYQEPTPTGKAYIKAPDGVLIYRVDPTPVSTTNQVSYLVKTKDNKINFYLSQS